MKTAAGNLGRAAKKAKREARVWLFDSGEASGYLYYVMPYIEGEPVSRQGSAEGAHPHLPEVDAHGAGLGAWG